MKKIILSVLSLALVLLAGCVVNSIYPFYTTKDLTFDPALLGTWGDAKNTSAEDKEVWVFEKLTDQTYKMTIRGDSETNEFDTHLFTLGGEKFLDSLPRLRMAYQTPEHLLFRVKSISPTLHLQFVDYEWLTKLVEQNPKAIPHIIVPNQAGLTNEGGHLTLTADTAELQKFLLQHLANTNAWSEPMVLKKR